MDELENKSADPIARLLAIKRETDSDILRRAEQGKGPAGYVSDAMRTCRCVHAIWRDRSTSGGYGHLLVSDAGRSPQFQSAREAVFEVDDRQRALALSRDFGGGSLPAGVDWALVLHVQDPDGGVDDEGYPTAMVIVDTSPEAGLAFKTLGFDVR